ncbi:unnamed protein product [Xylocopa violacea]|uniref:Uncharacterized protein n=1 Tax=Xylocopa violacea TaxID=135666 RepID=A0ABP1NDQ7_XYLVO
MFKKRRFVFILIVSLILMRSAMADIRKDCRKESKVSWAALRKMKSGDFEQEDPKLKCYVLCFMRKNGILDKDAEVDVERALRHLPRSLHDSSRKLFDKCKSLQGKDPCDKAFQMAKCYIGYHPEILHSVPFL